MLLGHKWHAAIDGNRRIRAWNGALNLYRPSRLFRSGSKTERVQPMNNSSVFAGRDRHIQRAGRSIDDRRAADTDFGRNQGVGRFGNRRYAGGWIDEAALPEWRCSF